MIPEILFKGMSKQGVLNHIYRDKLDENEGLYLEAEPTFLPHWQRALDRSIEYATRVAKTNSNGSPEYTLENGYESVVIVVRPKLEDKIRINGLKKISEHARSYTYQQDLPVERLEFYTSSGILDEITSVLPNKRIFPLHTLRCFDNYNFTKNRMKTMIKNYNHRWKKLISQAPTNQVKPRLFLSENDEKYLSITDSEEHLYEIVLGDIFAP
jgi:hypothetical protein